MVLPQFYNVDGFGIQSNPPLTFAPLFYLNETLLSYLRMVSNSHLKKWDTVILFLEVCVGARGVGCSMLINLRVLKLGTR